MAVSMTEGWRSPRARRQAGRDLLNNPDIRIKWITPTDFDTAWTVFQQFNDKAWSFTDCTSRVIMQRLGIEQAFAFDEHFRQFGTVIVVP